MESPSSVRSWSGNASTVHRRILPLGFAYFVGGTGNGSFSVCRFCAPHRIGRGVCAAASPAKGAWVKLAGP